MSDHSSKKVTIKEHSEDTGYSPSKDDCELIIDKLKMVLDDFVSVHVKYEVSEVMIVMKGTIAIGRINVSHERGDYSMSFSIGIKKMMNYGETQ